MDVTVAITNCTSVVFELGDCHLENARWRPGGNLSRGDVLSPNVCAFGRLSITQPAGPWSVLVLIPYEGQGHLWQVMLGSMQVSFGFEPADPVARQHARLWAAGDDTGRFIVQTTPVMTSEGLWVLIVVRDKWAIRRRCWQSPDLGREWRDPPGGGVPTAVV